MKAALAIVAASLLLMGGLVGIFFWEPWYGAQDREREYAWLAGYAAWSGSIEQRLERGERIAASSCATTFAARVGRPPEGRLRTIEGHARGVCGVLGRSATADAWRAERRGVHARIMDANEARAAAREDERLSRAASPVATRPVEVRCWPEEAWTTLNDDVVALSGTEEFWLNGYADPVRARIELSPSICEPLRRFYTGPYQPYLSSSALELARSLAVLAHEAEHVRNPGATEADVECWAMQDVRGMALAAGRKPWYAEELAGLAWEIGYPENFAEYRTADCLDGGRLDRDPDSAVWP